MYTLRNDVIIRREFFGGLAKYELDEFTTDFLLLFEKTNDEQQIVEIINSNYGVNATIYDIKELYDQAKYFLTTTNSLYRVDDVSKLAKEMKYEREEIKKIDFLAAPLNLSIYPGMKCNLSCDFCFISQEKWDDDKIVYPLEKWKPVFDQVKEMKIPYLTILGGEPLNVSRDMGHVRLPG